MPSSSLLPRGRMESFPILQERWRILISGQKLCWFWKAARMRSGGVRRSIACHRKADGRFESIVDAAICPSSLTHKVRMAVRCGQQVEHAKIIAWSADIVSPSLSFFLFLGYLVSLLTPLRRSPLPPSRATGPGMPQRAAAIRASPARG